MAENTSLQSRVTESVKHISANHQNSVSPGQYEQAQKDLTQLRLDLTTQKQENLVLKHKIDKLQAGLDQMKEVRNENLDLKSKAENLGKQLIAHMTSNSTTAIELEKLKLDNNFLKQNIEALKAQLGNSQNGSASIVLELEKSRAEVLKIKKEKEELEKKKLEIADLSAKLENAKDEFVDLMTRYSKLEAEHNRLRQENNSYRDDLDAMNKKTAGHENLVNLIGQEKDQLKVQLGMLREEAIESKLRVESLEAKLATREEDFSAIASANLALINEIEKIKSEYVQMKELQSTMASEITVKNSLVESDKDHKALVQALETQISTLESSEAKHSQQVNMLNMENSALQSEVIRLKDDLDRLLLEKDQGEASKKYTAVNFKLLEDQINLLEQENKKINGELVKISSEAELTKGVYLKNNELRSEVELLRKRNEYLESELTQRVREFASLRDSSEETIKNLREELKYLKERDLKNTSTLSGASGSPPLLGSASNSSRVIQEAQDEKQAKEKLILEINLAKLEKENRDKEARITSLESRLGDLNRELEKMKMVRKSHQDQLKEEELKQENQRLKAEITKLKVREGELSAQDEVKERMISHLQQTIKDHTNNSSSRNE